MTEVTPRKPGTFTKGDRRINRKGRPKTFDAMRELAQRLSHEEIDLKNGDSMTVIEAILRQWAQSKDPRLQIAFIEIAYGKVPTPVEHTGKDGGAVDIKVIRVNMEGE